MFHLAFSSIIHLFILLTSKYQYLLTGANCDTELDGQMI